MNLVFVGFGAANTFALLYLLERTKINGKDIVIVEKGKKVENRDKQKDILYGNIGSGLFSDNKMIFSEHTDQPLVKMAGIEKALESYEFIKEMIHKFHPEPNRINVTEPKEGNSNTEYKGGWGALAMKQSLCWHIGSHFGHIFGKNIEDYITSKGVKIINESSVTDIDGKFVYHEKGKIPYSKVFVGLGKTGKKLTEKILDKNNIKTVKNNVQIGVRFETPFNKDIQKVVEEQYDFKYSLDYGDDNIRSFCVCNNSAYVCEEKFDGHSGVRIQWNGEGYGMDNLEKRNYLTNFGIILSHQVEDGDEFMLNLEKRFNNEGFIYEGENCNYESSVTNLPKKVNLEEFRYYMSEEVADIILDFVEKINNILKFNGNFRMFLPEIKEVPGTINSNKFEIIDNIFYVGDGSPVCPTRGIIPAASTGILAAKELIEGK